MKQAAPGIEAYPILPRPSRSDREWAIALVREAQERADAIVADAETRAAELLLQAQAEQAAQLDELKAALLAQAREEVQAQLQAEMEATFGRFQDLIQQATVTAAELRATCQAELVALALAVAERVINKEISLDISTVERVAALALRHTPIERVTKVIVHPNDYPVLDRWATNALGSKRGQIEILTDPLVSPGGCMIGTKSGFIDARIKTQLSEIRHALAQVIDDE